MEHIPCEWCGQVFSASRSDAHFCNPACKQKYWRWKHHLELDRKTVMVTLDEIVRYLDKKETEVEAANVLGEIADRLAVFGFVARSEQLPFPEESYTIQNQLEG